MCNKTNYGGRTLYKIDDEFSCGMNNHDTLDEMVVNSMTLEEMYKNKPFFYL